jgi:hypothetical protein
MSDNQEPNVIRRPQARVQERKHHRSKLISRSERGLSILLNPNPIENLRVGGHFKKETIQPAKVIIDSFLLVAVCQIAHAIEGRNFGQRQNVGWGAIPGRKQWDDCRKANEKAAKL